MPAQHRVIIDTDPGVDDAMAVLFAAQHPDIELLGLTSVFGNVTTDVATRNALVLGDIARQHIPVARGAERPLKQAAQPVADFVHGAEGFGDMPVPEPSRQPVSQGAAEFICTSVNANPGELVLCAVGPLTNIAEALARDPSIASKVQRVVVMGGSIEAGGNATAFAEANIWQDPHAARAVLGGDWDVTMVGLDVTHDVICTPAQFASLADDAPVLGGFLNEAAQFYFDFHLKYNGFLGCHMHDPTAVIAITNPELFQTRTNPVDVIVDGEKAGQTVAASDDHPGQVRCCMDVNVNAVRQLFLDTIKSGF